MRYCNEAVSFSLSELSLLGSNMRPVGEHLDHLLVSGKSSDLYLLAG